MKLRVPHPRLLPLTITAMAALLLLKSIVLVQGALGSGDLSNDAAMVHAAEAAPAADPPRPAARPAEPAPAKEAAATLDAAPASPPPPPGGVVSLAPGAQPAAVPVSDAERQLLQDLRARKAELDARERATAEREAVLSAAEHKLSERVDQLTALQTRLEALDAERKQHDEANWAGLVKTYESMKPRDAATIFNDLDLAVLLPVLDRMKEAKAAPVLAAMQPERARLVTQKLAQMRSAQTAMPATTVGGG